MKEQELEYRVVFNGLSRPSDQTNIDVVYLLIKEALGCSKEQAQRIANSSSTELICNTTFSILENLKVRLNDVGAEVQFVATTKSQPEIINFNHFFNSYKSRLLESVNALNVNALNHLVHSIINTAQSGGSVYIFGNGGSASTASHLATDFEKLDVLPCGRRITVHCLNDNPAMLLMLGNDVGFEYVFKAQLANKITACDLVIAISSSGNSPNVINAVSYANEVGAQTFGIVGFDGGKLSKISANTIHVRSHRGDYGIMEDVTLMINHLVVNYICSHLSAPKEN